MSEQGCSRLTQGEHPAGGEGVWGTQREVPSFLYAMPVGGRRVFLEETCLVAKPALPFATLKRRLQRRLSAMGLKVGSLLCSYTARQEELLTAGFGMHCLQLVSLRVIPHLPLRRSSDLCFAACGT